MLYPSMDPNERFRARRSQERRRKRFRRAAAFAVALAVVIALAAGMTLAGKSGGERGAATPEAAGSDPTPAPAPATAARPRPLPVEVRGVHVTGALASLPGKLEEYAGYTRYGLNTIELDVKDEGGIVNFRPSSVPLAQRIGASRQHFKPREVARLARRHGVYLIGRVVVFQDPVLARARPDLAIRTPEGGVWQTSGGLAWVNPYDRRVWEYAVAIAEAAGRAGFDEIMFDYVRFPSDGDVGAAVYRNGRGLKKREAIPAFLRYAAKRLRPHGVRVGAAVFGLSAARDLGIGQLPRDMAPYLDTMYAMTYPSLFGPGELGIADPGSTPGETVSRALKRFQNRLRGTDVLLVPWIQDFTFTTPYDLEKVQAQIAAGRGLGAKGFLLWNAEGVYTDDALAAP